MLVRGLSVLEQMAAILDELASMPNARNAKKTLVVDTRCLDHLEGEEEANNAGAPKV